ncbi:MAG: SigE family RNA polymerase sigma factor [Micromonosporaceae bacterium]|nr:SigE family RNA polymerase sigma factor [Micromonosporaceae bacterium]
MRENADGQSEYSAFVSVNWSRYLRVAVLLTGDRHRAEELLQDSLVRLYVHWKRVADRGDPNAYLHKMLVNGNVSWWRRRRREQLVAEVPDRVDPGGQPERHERLRAALRSLPYRQRAVVVLRHYADLPERQVAQILGCSVGAVKTHNSRALNRLRELLAWDSTDDDVKEKETVR